MLEISSLTLLCIYAPTDIAISTGISKSINYEIFNDMVFLWLKKAEFLNFAPEFIICGALCIEYQFKSPFFSKIVMAERLLASPLDPARQILSVYIIFFRFWITFVSRKLKFF